MWMRKKEKAVYTVEAALIMPLVLLVVLLAVRVGVDLHTKVKDASCHYEKLEQVLKRHLSMYGFCVLF